MRVLPHQSPRRNETLVHGVPKLIRDPLPTETPVCEFPGGAL
jgi:hypothetical protein